MGWIAQGQMPPAVEKTIFSLAKGAVSDAVDTPAGFQIFKVEDVKNEKTQTLKEASAEITKTLKAEKAKREAGKIADKDREKALSGSDLTKVAQESGAKLSVTNWLANGETVPEIGENQELYTSLGTALGDLGRPDDAIAAFQHALALNPNNAETNFNLGLLLLNLQRTDEAIAD